jgi:hypothetical protein
VEQLNTALGPAVEEHRSIVLTPCDCYCTIVLHASLDPPQTFWSHVFFATQGSYITRSVVTRTLKCSSFVVYSFSRDKSWQPWQLPGHSGDGQTEIFLTPEIPYCVEYYFVKSEVTYANWCFPRTADLLVVSMFGVTINFNNAMKNFHLIRKNICNTTLHFYLKICNELQIWYTSTL